MKKNSSRKLGPLKYLALIITFGTIQPVSSDELSHGSEINMFGLNNIILKSNGSDLATRLKNPQFSAEQNWKRFLQESQLKSIIQPQQNLIQPFLTPKQPTNSRYLDVKQVDFHLLSDNLETIDKDYVLYMKDTHKSDWNTLQYSIRNKDAIEIFKLNHRIPGDTHQTVPLKTQTGAIKKLFKRLDPTIVLEGGPLIGNKSQWDSCDIKIKKYREALLSYQVQIQLNEVASRLVAELKYMKASRDYAKHCANPTQYPGSSANVSIPKTKRSKIKHAVEEKATEIIGAIGLQNSEGPKGISYNWCMATYIGSNKIVTAKHCIFGIPTEQKKQRRKDLENGKVLFSRISAPTEFYVVKYEDKKAQSGSFLDNIIEEASPDYIPLLEDRVVLTLDRPIKTQVKANFTHLPNSGDQIMILGSIEHSIKPKRDKSNWVRKIHSGAFMGCFIEHVKDGCLVHTCQTDPGYSGSPLIDISSLPDKNIINILGMHLQSASVSSQENPINECTSPSWETSELNLALSAEKILSN